MSEPTSVRPELLSQFAASSRALESHLDARIRAVRAAIGSYVAGTDPGLVTSNPSLVETGLTDMVNRLEATRRFAELLREAVLAADVSASGGVVTLTNAQLMDGLTASGRQEFQALLDPAPLPPIDPPTVGTIPQSSGFVDDPVCTATGHFLEDEVDLAVPARLAPLAWPRRYSSRQLDVGGHGPGWWTWAEAACRVEAEAVVLVCPDGRHVTFPRPAPGELVSADGDDVALGIGADGELVVRWGLRSRSGPETWRFDADGALREIDAALAGRTHVERDEQGRLVGLAHDGGRTLRVEWDGDRIAAVHDGAGRTARYRYDDGHLAEVQRDLGGRTYATDVQGRIVEVVDADGVTLARNRYDADGRVVRQVAPTGRVTVFRYEPGRRTAVLDGSGDLIALYVHDHRGRVQTFVSPHGAELTRSFDGDGRVASQLAHDGSGFTSEGSAGPDGVLRILHHDGRREELVHDHLGRVVRHDVRGAGTVRFEYEGDSICPTAVVSPSGARRTMTWRDGGVLVGVADADGVAFELDVDGDGLPRAATDSAGNVARAERHVTGVPTRIVLPDGSQVTADVDGAGRLTRIVAADSVESTLEYSPAGRLTALVAGDGGRTEIHHGPHGFVESVTDPSGRTERIEIDEWGRPVAVGGTGDTPGWTLGWSPLGVLTEVTTPGGAHWRSDLDDHHRISAITDPAERTTSIERDHAGRLVGFDGPGGSVTVEHDIAGRPVSIDAVPGGTDALVRDTDGAVVEVRDADGVRTRTTYTPGGRVTSVQVGDDEAVAFDHDAAGHVAAVRRGARTWHLEHDWRGALVELTTPSGRRSRIRRDALGRPVEIDVDGRAERWAYDPAGRVARWVRPSGATTALRHDLLGRLVEVSGPGGDSRLDHDLDAGTTTVTDPLGGRSQVAVDADGRVVARTDQLDRTTSFEHTPDGRLQAVIHPDGSRLGFEHDDQGRVGAAYSDGTALARYRYGDGHLVEAEEPGAGRATTFETSAAGRLVGWSDAAGTTVVERDDAGRVTARRSDALPDLRWAHATSERRGTLAGREVAVATDPDGALAAVRLGDRTLHVERGDGGEVAELALEGGDDRRAVRVERDRAGRIVTADVDGLTTRYGYDDADRLASRSTDGGERTEWRYDAAGRLTNEIRTDADGTFERRFEHDAAHQLVAVHGPEGTVRYDHDAAGRRVAEHRPDGTTRRYEWDALGRLTAVVDGVERIEVDIDCFGRLRRVGGTELAWDLSSPVPELAAVDGVPVLAAGHLVLGVGDQLLPASILGPAAAGTGPWGHAPVDATVSLDCGLPGGIGFAGLIWLGDRVLDPATGEFLTPDPLAGAIGSPTGSFPYAYADADPINRADPTGRSGQPISIQDFEQMREEATSANWGNIAMVAGTVAMVGLAFVPGVNVVMFVAAGTVVGGLQGAGMSHQNTGSIDPGSVLLGAGIGGLTTFTGVVGGRALHGLMAPGATSVSTAGTSTVRTVATRAGASAAAELPAHLVGEAAMSTYEGRSFDSGNVVQNTLLSGLSGGVTAFAPSPVSGADAVTPAPATAAPPSAMPQPSLPAPALPAPVPQPALPAGPQPLALTAGPQPLALPAGSPAPAPAPAPVVRPTASLSLPSPPPGFVQHTSGLYLPQ